MITFTSTNNVGSGVSGPKLSAIFPFLMRSRLENLLFRLWILLGRFLLTNRRCLKKKLLFTFKVFISAGLELG